MKTQLESDSARPMASTLSRVVVGIDGSPESLEAARQAAIVGDGPVFLVTVYELSAALVGGMAPAVPAALDEAPFREASERSLAAAQEAIGDAKASAEVYRGRPWSALLEAIDDHEATMVAVGSHGTGRALGIVIGSTATELIHKAPCSVLVARAMRGEFPSRIVVGVDGSAESLAAYETAEALAARFGARLDPLFAHLDEGAERYELQQRLGRRVRTVFNYPVDALVSASADADLVVLGSRGLSGVKALGSVSERVAHGSAASVLIVRKPSGR